MGYDESPEASQATLGLMPRKWSRAPRTQRPHCRLSEVPGHLVSLQSHGIGGGGTGNPSPGKCSRRGTKSAPKAISANW
jgi:hypothetical protein